MLSVTVAKQKNFVKSSKKWVFNKALFFFSLIFMRYYYEKPDIWTSGHATDYKCNHPLYSECTLYFRYGLGLAVVQQRFDADKKIFWWGPVDPWLAEDIYNVDGFGEYFHEHAKKGDENALFPTVNVRTIMWALRMKPLKREFWEQKMK